MAAARSSRPRSRAAPPSAPGTWPCARRLRSAARISSTQPRGRLTCTLGAVERSGPGEACTTAADCPSGFCADGVCCDSACGGSDPGDCQACSQKAGAATDGKCTLLTAATVCRAAAGDCDLPERCDGTAPTCPADALAPALQICRPSARTGDQAELCDGTTPRCPTDDAQAAGTGCACSLSRAPRPTSAAEHALLLSLLTSAFAATLTRRRRAPSQNYLHNQCK